MFRAYLPKALAFTLLTASLPFAGAQQASATTPQDASQQQDAPHHHHHAPDPQHQAAFLTKKLNLTSDQTAKIEPILADRDQKLEALRANQDLARDDRRQQMRAINEQAQQQMAGVLSPDQVEQLKAMRHHRHGHGDRQPGQDGQSSS